MRLADCTDRVRFACRSCRRVVWAPLSPLTERFGPEKPLADLRPRCSKCGSVDVEVGPWERFDPGQVSRHS